MSQNNTPHAMVESFLEKYGVSFSSAEREKLDTYYRLLIRTNETMNLTAITDYEDVWTKHFLDSLMIQRVTEMREISDCIDVGTGAGFPGIPLKIVFPGINMTLMDSLQKRVKFLQNVIDELGLCSILAVHARAEDAAVDNKYREKFSLCVSRAVSNLSTLTEYCLPFVKQGGIFVAYKGMHCEDEVKNAGKAIKMLGGDIIRFEQYQMDGSENEDFGRSLIVIKKVKKTPSQYPRKAGLPKKEPIK